MRIRIFIQSALLLFAFSIIFLFVGLYGETGCQDACFTASFLFGLGAFFAGLLAYLED